MKCMYAFSNPPSLTKSSYYIHQYFTSRGAQVSFGCPGNFSEVVLSDFFKPTYKGTLTPSPSHLTSVRCDVSISSPDIGIQLSKFDAIYIPGGVPSSTAVRTEKAFVSALWNFVMNPANKGTSPPWLVGFC